LQTAKTAPTWQNLAPTRL